MTQRTRSYQLGIPTGWRLVDYAKEEGLVAPGQRTRLSALGYAQAWRDIDYGSTAQTVRVEFDCTFDGTLADFDRFTVRVPMFADVTATLYEGFASANVEVDAIRLSLRPFGHIEFEWV